MGRRNLFAILVSVSVAAGCGGSPTAPSSDTSKATSSLAAQSAVMSAMAQAISQVAVMGPFGGAITNPLTIPCAGGGSIVATFESVPPQQSTVYRSSSRIEFHDCKNQGTTVNGDPYLETSGEHAFPTQSGAGGDSVSTLRTTGGLRTESTGVQGRVRFDCTMTIVLRWENGSPQPSMTATGTTTFEQPLGSTPVVRPCGPA
jgi:hypothetical protein